MTALCEAFQRVDKELKLLLKTLKCSRDGQRMKASKKY